MKTSDRTPTRERQLPRCFQRVAWRSKSPDRDNLHQRLQQLVAEARSYPPKSWQRRQKLTEIVRTIVKSGKLWQENTPYYNDALQQTWLIDFEKKYLMRARCPPHKSFCSGLSE